jgi:tetratricopeptide (TPR) repeat protein
MLGRSDVAALEAEADAAVERMRNPAMRAELDVSLARVRVVGGRAPDAVALLARALAVYDHLAITAPRRTTAVLQDLGAALQVTGDLDGAQTALDRGYALATAALGADADETVELRGARATNLMYRDQPEAAAELAAVAAAMARSSPGPSAGRVAVESYRCELAIAQRDVVTGTAACRDTVAHAEALFGADSPRLTWPLLVLGRFLAQTGELRAAAARFERAIALSAAGAETPVLPALARGQLALTYRALGDRRAAVQTAEARAALAPLAADPEAAALLDELR